MPLKDFTSLNNLVTLNTFIARANYGPSLINFIESPEKNSKARSKIEVTTTIKSNLFQDDLKYYLAPKPNNFMQHSSMKITVKAKFIISKAYTYSF